MSLPTLEISTDAAQMLTIFLTIAYVLILSPISLFYAYKLWLLKRENVSFITKRHPRIVILSVILFNIYTAIILPICDLSALFGVPLIWFRVFLYSTAQIGILIISLRVWLLYYDYNHELQTLALKWKEQIRKQPDKQSWTTRHQWMGNVTLLLSISAILAVILLAITMSCYSVFGAESLKYTCMIPTIYVIFVIVMIFKVRSCRDEFCIQKEFKLIVLWMLVFTVIYAVIIAPFLSVQSNLYRLAMNIWISSASYMFAMIPTYWVIKQYYGQIMQQRPNLYPEDTFTISSHSKMERKLSLEEILSTKDGFDVFANHLVREFSIENLFFVFEIMQIKHDVLMKNLVSDGDIGYMVSIDSGRMDKIRRTDSSVGDFEDIRKSVKYIMEQYIYSGSPYCVNLSSFTRLNVLKMYNELEGGGKLIFEPEIIDLENEESMSNGEMMEEQERMMMKRFMLIFDNAMSEVVHLLKTDSLVRFRLTNEYKIMVQATP